MINLKVGIAGYGIVGNRRCACVNRNPHMELVYANLELVR